MGYNFRILTAHVCQVLAGACPYSHKFLSTTSSLHKLYLMTGIEASFFLGLCGGFFGFRAGIAGNGGDSGGFKSGGWFAKAEGLSPGSLL